MRMPAEAMVVGVCTRNRGPAILPTLRAIDAMDDAGGRVARTVVVDNGSTDQTGRIVTEFAAGPTRRPMVVLHEPRRGKANALETLFARTTEPLVATIDDDVLVDRGWAAAILAAMDELPRAGVVGGRIDLELEGGGTRWARVAREHLAEQDLGHRRVCLNGDRLALAGAAFAKRRCAIEQCGYFARRRLDCLRGDIHSNGTDSECCAMVRAAGWDLWYEPAAAARHCVPRSRQSREYVCRLAHSCALGEAYLHSILRGATDAAWAAACRDHARRRARREWMLRWWEPGAAVRRAYARGRAEGWEALTTEISGSASSAW